MPMKRLIIAALYLLAPKTCHRLRLERDLARKLFEPEIDLVPRLCSRNGTAIDVGAGNGEYAYVMSKYAGTVHAFEPNATTCALLCRGLPASVKVHEVALSDRAGSATMRVPRSESLLGTVEATNPLTRRCEN